MVNNQMPPVGGGLTAVASGDNMTGHVVSVASLGGAFAAITTWGLQLGHIMPPADVTAAFGIIGTVVASLVLQKISS